MADPWPYDILLNGEGFLLGRDPSGSPLYREEWRSTTEPVERVKAWTGFPGGVGVRNERGVGESDAAYYMQHVVRTGIEPVGGGCDIRFGPVIKGPYVQGPVVLQAGACVRRLVKWRGLYYAAVGPVLWRSSTPDFSAGLVPLRTFDADILDLCPFAGQGGPSELNVAVRNWPREIYDGTTFTPDGGPLAGLPRAGVVSSFVVDRAGTLTDATAAVTDTNPATGADLGALAAGTGRVLVGGLEPPLGVVLGLAAPNVNTVAGTVAAAYWSGTAWVPLAINEDATAVAGVPLAQSGAVRWQHPTAAWLPAITVPGAAGFYYVRLSWSATLSAGGNPPVIVEATTEYRREADGFTVVGPRLLMSSGRQRLYWTEGGGAQNTWQGGVAYATPDADVVGLFTARGGGYVHKLDGLYTLDGDDLAVQVALYNPPLARRDATPHTVWLDQAYLEMGRGSLIQLSPNPGGVAALEPVGPERLAIDEAQHALVRVTAVAGDRLHFLYAAVDLSDGTSALAAWGVYRQVRNPQTGTLEWSRHDAWSVIANLRERRVTELAIWVDAGDGNWLVAGDEGGSVVCVRLPAGVSPLGDPDYRYSTVDGLVRPPVFEADDPSRPLVVYGARALGPHLTDTEWARVQVLDPYGDPTIALGDVRLPASGVRVAFAAGPLEARRGAAVRLILHTDDPTQTPIVERFEVAYQGLVRAEQATITATVLADDDVRDNDGAATEWAAADWRRALNTALANVRDPDGHVAPLVMTGTDGTARRVLVQGRRDDQARRRETRAAARAVTLTLVTAEGGGS